MFSLFDPFFQNIKLQLLPQMDQEAIPLQCSLQDWVYQANRPFQTYQ